MTVLTLSARTEILLRLAMPAAIIIGALLIYRAETKPYDECVRGSLSLSHEIGTLVRLEGPTSIDEATALVECGKRH